MAFFPKVQSPCPYKDDLSAVMDGDFCRMCERQVVDLTAWSDGERRAFLAACEDEVCVSYRLPLRAAAAAAAFAAAAVAMPSLAAAQEPAQAAAQATAADPQVPSPSEPAPEFIIVGGIRNPSAAEFVRVPDHTRAPELPVVYEEGDAAAPAKTQTQSAEHRPGA